MISAEVNLRYCNFVISDKIWINKIIVYFLCTATTKQYVERLIWPKHLRVQLPRNITINFIWIVHYTKELSKFLRYAGTTMLARLLIFPKKQGRLTINRRLRRTRLAKLSLKWGRNLMRFGLRLRGLKPSSRRIVKYLRIWRRRKKSWVKSCHQQKVYNSIKSEIVSEECRGEWDGWSSLGKSIRPWYIQVNLTSSKAWYSHHKKTKLR